MKEIIQVGMNKQGTPVVSSARAFYDFLGFEPTHWARWSKKNIVENPYARQGTDWEVYANESKTSVQGGRPSTDYSLTLDFAKRLSLQAPTQKGEEIRQYFLDCEAKVQHFNSQVFERLHSLEKQMRQLQEREYQRMQTRENLIPFTAPLETTRTKAARIVTDYADQHSQSAYTLWNKVWDRLHLLYGYNIRAQQKANFENLLDVAERHGQIDRVLEIVISGFRSE